MSSFPDDAKDEDNDVRGTEPYFDPDRRLNFQIYRAANDDDHSSFSFVRTIRTFSSERYVIWIRKERIRAGYLDLHFDNKIYYGALLLECPFSDQALDQLCHEIEQILPEPFEIREEFCCDVFEGRQRTSYSDAYTDERRLNQPASRRDLTDMHKSLSRFVGKSRKTQSMLFEHATVEYFSRKGYEAHRGESVHDSDGIDVIAENDEEIVLVQVKLGQTSLREMARLMKATSAYTGAGGKQKTAAMVARTFHPVAEFERRRLEKHFGFCLMCIRSDEILRIMREYTAAID